MHLIIHQNSQIPFTYIYQFLPFNLQHQLLQITIKIEKFQLAQLRSQYIPKNTMSTVNILAILCFGLVISVGQALFGFRATSLLTVPVYQCLRSSKYEYGLIDIVSSEVGITDVRNVVNARTAGVNASVVYSPCRNRKAYEQALSFAEKVPRGAFNGTVWVYANSFSTNCKWSKTQQTQNCQYYKELTQELRNYYLQVGIATRSNEWQSIFGGSKCKQMDVLPLAWINPDQNPTFGNFVSFGGWKYPNLKEFKEGLNLCGANINLEYFT